VRVSHQKYLENFESPNSHPTIPIHPNNFPLHPTLQSPLIRYLLRTKGIIQSIMSSDLKTKSARANGAKSRGPATPEGRAKSSRNSLRHGLSAKTVVLPAESRDQFQLLLDAHIQQFQPANSVEADLVEAMAIARWRLRRIWAIETSLLANELTRRAEDIDDEFTEMTSEDRLAWVFETLANGGQSLSLLARYEGNLNRAFDRAFKQLNILKSQRQNEPKPAPTSPRTNALHWPEQQPRGGSSCETSSEALVCSRQESSLEHSLCSRPQLNKNSPPACA